MTRKEAIEYLQPIADGSSLKTYTEALNLAIDALRFQEAEEKNIPMTAERLATMDYSAPPDAPNINKMTWRELAQTTRLGEVRSKHIVNERTMKGKVYTCPSDLLGVRYIGPGIAASLIGKVRFGLED